MVPTPVSMLAEGIATTAADILGPETREAAIAILRKHGVEYDDARAKEIADAFKPIGRIGVDVALRIHEDGMSDEDAVAWGMKWGVTTEARARQGVRFVTDPTWRAYTICYSTGEDLVRGYTKDDLIADLQKEFDSQLVGVDFNFSQYIQDNVEEGLSGVKGANSVKTIGPDLAVLEDIARKVMAEMVNVPGITDLGAFWVLGQPNLNIKIDRQKRRVTD